MVNQRTTGSDGFERFVDRCAERLRAEISDAVAIRLVGSTARGDAGPASDVDFDVLVDGEPDSEGCGWVDALAGRVVYVSAWVRRVRRWQQDQDSGQEWAFGVARVE